eukprot:11169213-Lingulodinium_polyedra.AAC.1
MHWCVQAQLLRRGGLKSGPRVEPHLVDGRVAQLRAAAKAEEETKRAPQRRAAGQWRPPAEFSQADLTEAEQDLAALVAGPDPAWGREARPGGKPVEGPDPPVPPAHQAYAERLERVDLPACCAQGSEGLRAY